MNLPSFNKLRPLAGESVDRKDTVELKVPVQRPWIILHNPGVDVLLSRALLVAISAHGEQGANNLLERQRSVNAQSILNRMGRPGPHGDYELPTWGLQANDRLNQDDARPLVGLLLENGLAEVIQYGPFGKVTAPPRIQVHYKGETRGSKGGSGSIIFGIVNVHRDQVWDANFFQVAWWKSAV